MVKSSGALKELTGLPRELLEDWVTGEMGMKAYRAGQLFSWIHRKRVRSFDEMTDISLEARKVLGGVASLTVLEAATELRAEDGTVKQCFQLEDGAGVESVLIPDPPRLTACLSSQAGCRCGCTFCRTGLGGFRRNLTAAEMVAQLYALQDSCEDRISNVVFMGMGEPMDNFDNLSRALSIISDDSGICIGARKITVSTVGLPGGIDRLVDLDAQYGLAVSLHSAVEGTRRRLVPVSGAMPLDILKSDIRRYNLTTGRRATLEYCLISGVNDSLEEAEALVEFSSGLECKINLLVYNPVPGLDFRTPGEDTVRRFARYLYPRCQAVTLRRSRGGDIAAACGQLGGGDLPPGSESYGG